MSPQVYLKLVPVALKNGKFVSVSEKEAQDYFIEMSLVDTKFTLSNLIIEKKVLQEHIKNLSKIIEQKKDILAKEKYKELAEIHYGWNELYGLRIKDLKKFSSEQSKISNSLLNRALNVLQKNHEKSPYFRNFPKNKLSAGIDSHSDNIIISGKDILFTDIFLVEEHWRLIDSCFDLCRIAVDLESLGQPELVQVLYNSSKNNPYNLPKDILASYELSSSLIKGIYNFAIGKENLGKLYIPTIERLTACLESL